MTHARSLVCLLALLFVCSCSTQRRRKFETDPAALGPYSGSVLQGGLCFVSGKIGETGGSFEVEVETAIDAVAYELSRSSVGLHQVVESSGPAHAQVHGASRGAVTHDSKLAPLVRLGERRHERAGERALREEIPQQVGDLEGDVQGVGEPQRAHQRGAQRVAHEPEDAREKDRERDQAGGAREPAHGCG